MVLPQYSYNKEMLITVKLRIRTATVGSVFLSGGNKFNDKLSINNERPSKGNNFTCFYRVFPYLKAKNKLLQLRI